MNPEAVEVLKKILSKEPREITPQDAAFMLARRKYVGPKSRAKFAEVFAHVGEDEVVEAPAEAPPIAPDIINHPGDLEIPIESEDRTPEETEEKLAELNSSDQEDDGEVEVQQA